MPNKLRFSIIYLVASLVTLALCTMSIKNFWYPYPLMQAAGAQNLLIIIILVNVSLAFAFAIMIFIKTKIDFKKDIIISMLIQLLFLTVSLYGVYNIKPVWMAYNVDRFELILNNDLVSSDIYKADKQYKNPNLLPPQYVGVNFAQNNEERTQNMFDEALRSISIARRPERYVPFTRINEKVRNRAQNLIFLEEYNDKTKVEFFIEKYPQADSFVPLQANAVDMTVLLDKNSDKQVIAIVDLRPW